MKLTKHFDSSELACPCCGKHDMDDEFMRRLETIRVTLNKPIRISSGFRCIKRNQAVGGSRNSAHLLGLAVDCIVADSRDRFLIVNTAMQIGIRRIGIGQNFIHLDMADDSTGHPPSVLWHYYK